MQRLIALIILIGCMGLGAPAGAECWGWTTNGKPTDFKYDLGDVWDNLWMSFDEVNGHSVLLMKKDYHDANKGLELWHFDGQTWLKSWEGYIIPPAGFFGGPTGLYFDRNQNTLVLIAGIQYDFEITSLAAFKYVDGQGWVYITEADTCGSLQRDVLAVYDSRRSRAVLVLSYCHHGDNFVEFDGFQFYYVNISRNDFNFQSGAAGYNPDAGSIVFFGYNSGHGYSPKVYEYHDDSWSYVNTTQSPPGNYLNYGDLPYIPSLYGMILIPGWGSVRETWIYRNQNWENLNVESQPPVLTQPRITFNSTMNKVVLFGGMLDDGSASKLTWELKKGWHCRPLSKP